MSCAIHAEVVFKIWEVMLFVQTESRIACSVQNVRLVVVLSDTFLREYVATSHIILSGKYTMLEFRTFLEQVGILRAGRQLTANTHRLPPQRKRKRKSCLPQNQLGA